VSPECLSRVGAGRYDRPSPVSSTTKPRALAGAADHPSPHYHRRIRIRADVLLEVSTECRQDIRRDRDSAPACFGLRGLLTISPAIVFVRVTATESVAWSKSMSRRRSPSSSARRSWHHDASNTTTRRCLGITSAVRSPLLSRRWRAPRPSRRHRFSPGTDSTRASCRLPLPA